MILAEEKHKNLCKELVERYTVEYTAGEYTPIMKALTLPEKTSNQSLASNSNSTRRFSPKRCAHFGRNPPTSKSQCASYVHGLYW